MISYKTTLLMLVFSFILKVNSTLANDTPCSATPIVVNTTCSTATFSNATSSNSGVPDPGCAGYGGSDIWFTFTMPNYGYHTVIELFGGTMTDGGMAVYSGPDCSNLTLVSCDDNSGTGNMPSITVEDGCLFQDAGATFWVRVWENGNDNNGTFDICAYSTNPSVPAGVTSCGGNLIAGDACCDALLLGEDLDGYCGNTGSYNDIPDEITNFCAFIDNNSWLAFIASSTSVDISIVSSNCIFGNGIQVGILETFDCTNFTTVSNCWNPGAEASGNLVATGLTVGQTYYIMVDGWAGDICDYTLGIVSGVETVSVYADDENICQGQSTQLHADVIGSGTYIYNWAPAASLNDPTIANPIASPTTTTNYSVTISGVEDSIHTVEVIVYPAAPSLPTINGPASVCENSTGMMYTASATNAVTYNWVVTNGAITGGNGLDTILVDWGNTDGSVCVTAENNCGLSMPECLAVMVTSQPDITATDPPAGCAPDPFDLTTITVTNAGGGSGLISYYGSLNDATNSTNEILPPQVSTGGTYYIKMETGPGCFDIDSATVVIEDPVLVVVDPAVECSPDSVDLDNVVITEVNGYPGGTQTYYADSLDAVNSINSLASSVVYTGGTYWVRYETPNGCGKVAPIQVTIGITPDISINQPLPLCPGGSIDLDTISYTEANGSIYIEEFYDNFIFADLGILPLTSTIVSNPQTYYLRAETTENCYQIVEIIITAGVTPDAEINGGGTFCDGETTDIFFTLNGSGPFTVVYTDGVTNYTLNDISDNHTEVITISGNVTYSLVSVFDANGCTGNLLGGPVDIISNPAPTATISGDASICASGAVDIDFTFTGTGPFDAIYTDGSTNYNLSGVNSVHAVNHTLTSNTTFTLISVTDASGCTGSLSGSATIMVYPQLQVNNIAENCDPSFTSYTISFEITGGDPGTYNVTGDPVTLVGNIFTSDPIASGSTYSFTVNDNSGCTPELVTGSYDCSCGTDAGQMDLNLIGVCENETAIATFMAGSETLNLGDVFQFVLHDNSGTSLGNIITTSSIPEFNWQPGIVYGTTYYISPTAGPDDGFGSPDVNHGCFSVGPGTPVVFYQLPDAVIAGDTTICESDCTDLVFNFSAGTAPFNVLVSDGTNSFSVNNVDDNDVFSVCPGSTTTYTLLSVEDNTGAQCNGTVSGSATVTVLPALQINNITENCDPSFATYTVSFEITGGDSGSYNVIGDPGTLSGNIFTSDPITNGAAYNFDISDSSPCLAQSVSGTFTCVCTTYAGDMNLSPLDVCEDEVGIASYINGSGNLYSGDVFQYVIHDNPDTTLGTVFGISSTPEFGLQVGMLLGMTYYISPVAGPDDGSGDADVNHLCFSVGQGTPVTFYELPEAIISGDASICEGGASDLIFNFTAGTGPFDVVINDGANNITVNNLNDGDSFSVSPITSTSYTIVSVVDSSPAACSGVGTGTATITVHQAPQTTNVQYICNDINTQYQVIFEITGGDPGSYIINGDPGTLSGNTFTSDFINTGTPYSFQVDDVNACGPTDESGNYACNCTSNAGNMATDLINACEDETAVAQHNTTNMTFDGNDVLGFVLYDQSGSIPGSVMLTNSVPEFNYDPSLTFGVTYYISAIVGNDDGSGFPILDSSIDPCLSISNGQPIRFTQTPELSISGTVTICEGDSTDIVFSMTSTGPFDIIFTDGINNYSLDNVTDGYVHRVSPAITTTYTLTSINQSNSPFCGGVLDPVNNSITVDVIDVPEVVNINSECNQAGTSFTITFEITGGSPMTYNVSGDPGTLSGNVFTSAPLISGSTYIFTIDDGSGCPPVTISSTEYCNCTPDIKPLISLVESISCFGENDGVLSVQNENGVAPFSFQWSSGVNGTLAEQLNAGWHYVTMTDGNNCLSIDSIFLDQPSAIVAEMTTIPPSCFGENDAEITFDNVSGGSGGYTFDIDYYTSYIQNNFYNLPAGVYEGIVTDSDGCVLVDTVVINDPPQMIVDLGDDIILNLGDSIQINPLVSLPVESFSWQSSNYIDCPECWIQTVTPMETVIYTFSATAEDGCSATDQLIITVDKDRPLFIPNAFSPDGDGENDIFRAYSGGSVQIINEFRIFDRWGALVYEAQNVVPAEDDFGWDGRLKGEPMANGVYVYYLKVVYIDGETEIITGDVTLLK